MEKGWKANECWRGGRWGREKKKREEEKNEDLLGGMKLSVIVQDGRKREGGREDGKYLKFFALS